MILPGFIVSSVLIVGLAYYMYVPDAEILSSVSPFTQQVKSMLTYVLDLINVPTDNRVPTESPDEDGIVTSHEILGDVHVLIHRPTDSRNDALHHGIVYFHGGGWISGSTEEYKKFTHYLSKKSGLVVISVEYRLAPEFTFPIPFEDCLQATLHLLRNPSKFGLKQITLAGDDVGGNLALSVSLSITKDNPKLSKNIHMVGMFYSPLQAFDFNLPSYAKFSREQDKIGKEDIVEQFSLYLFGKNDTIVVDKLMRNLHTTPEQKNSERAEILDFNVLPYSFRDFSEPGLKENAGDEQLSRDISHLILDDRVSPMLASVEHLENLPYTYFIAPGEDPVRDESFMLYAALRELDMDKTEHMYYREEMHGFLKLFHNDIAKTAISDFISHLKKRLRGER